MEHLDFRYFRSSDSDIDVLDVISNVSPQSVRSLDVSHADGHVDLVNVMDTIRKRGMNLQVLDMDTTFHLCDEATRALCDLIDAGCCKHVKIGRSMGLVSFSDDKFRFIPGVDGRVGHLEVENIDLNHTYKRHYALIQQILVSAENAGCKVERYRLLPNEYRYNGAFSPKNHNEEEKKKSLAELIYSKSPRLCSPITAHQG